MHIQGESIKRKYTLFDIFTGWVQGGAKRKFPPQSIEF